ncbi:ATP-dependent DNA helicase srs2 [Cryptotrichosporon argae]
MEPWLDTLNPSQRAAVTTPASTPLQILAGPGSGKTRVLTSRVAWLVRHCALKPHQITAVTFTNKAASEMRKRLEALLGKQDAGELVLGTFHATCVRYLRRYGNRIGLSNNFAIADADDCKKIMSALIKANPELAAASNDPLKESAVLSEISKAKAKGVTPELMAARATAEPGPSSLTITAELYALYEATLGTAGALDFDDLLVYGLKLFKEHEDILESCFHVLVDEFQDTNITQYELMRCFAKAHGGVTIVGDPDQSIYGWRSAEVGNLDQMTQDFSGVQAIFLEENYRSTGSILAASHAVVSQDRARVQKQLRTSHPQSTAVTLKQFGSPVIEASFVATEIKRLVAYSGGMLNYADFAILLRTNALSRNIESALQKDGIPCRLIGGHKFFERLEIKDLLAYLQIADNSDFTPAFMRAVNVPSRKIGEKSVQDILAAAKAAKVSPMELCERVVDGDKLPVGIKPSLKHNLAKFVGVVRRLRRASAKGMTVADLIRLVIERTEYETHLRTTQEDFDQRWENVQELISYSVIVAEDQRAQEGKAAYVFDEAGDALPGAEQTRLHPMFRRSVSTETSVSSRRSTDELVDEPAGTDEAIALTPLRYFLQTSMLSTDTQSSEDQANVPKVTISTVHAAKGLEWPVVFIPAVEQGTYPSFRCTEPHEIAEERRLLYVAMTRAQAFLTLSYCQYRMTGGEENNKELSEFVASALRLQPNLFSTGLPDVNLVIRNQLGAMLSRFPAHEEETKAAIMKHVRAAPPLSTWDAPEPRGYAHNRFARRETTKAARAADYWASDVDEYALPAPGSGSSGAGFAPASRLQSVSRGDPRIDPPPAPRPQPPPIRSANRDLPAPLPFTFGTTHAATAPGAGIDAFTSSAGAGLAAMKALGLPADVPAAAPVVGAVPLARGTKRLGMGRPAPWGAKKAREG